MDISNEDPLAKTLFTNTVRTRPALKRRRDDHRPPSGLCLLCGIVVVLAGLISLPLSVGGLGGKHPLQRLYYLINTETVSLIISDVPLFLSNEQFSNHTHSSGDATPIPIGAFPLSLVAGVTMGLLVHLCMFYDSAHPGVVPRSPYTPTSRLPREHSPSQISLGYRMIPGNIVAFGILSLIMFRLYCNIPLL